VVDAVAGLLRHGVDRRRSRSEGAEPAVRRPQLAHANGSKAGSDAPTRSQILAAAEAEFGQSGFHAASVADIARRAEVAHGTVYRHFPSKEALFADVVREINRQLRAQIRRQTDDLADRRAAERAGFRAFFDFIAEHARMYRVVREAEFVGSAHERVGPWYYHRLAERYMHGIQTAVARGEWREVDAEVLAWSLMGTAHFWGLRWIVWEQTMPPTRVFDVLDHLLSCGLTPSNDASR
jgi:AcrR family transcriptional regulator